jgi:large subunit ribosomal protein L17
MTKAYSKRKLQRPTKIRMMLLRNLSESLLLSEKITTTVPKAKELQSYVEKIITRAKKGGVNAHRNVFVDIKNKVVIKKMFEVFVPRYADRAGGYTQIFRLSLPRRGDSAPMAIIKLVQ